MPAFITIILFFVLPFLYLPISGISYEIPKVIAAEALIDLLILWSILKSKTIARLAGPAGFAFISILALSMIHLVSLRTPLSFWGNANRGQGIFLLWHLLAFSLLAYRIKLNEMPFWFPLTALIALTGTAFLFGINPDGRAFGTLGEPNALAATALIFWPLIFINSKNRSIKLISIILAGLIIFLTGSRSGLLGLIMQLAFLAITRVQPLYKLALIVCAAILVIGIALQIAKPGVELENRVEIWQTAWHAGTINPIFGGGFGNTENTLHQGALELTNNLRFQYIDSAHNLLLDWWVEGGLIGLGIIIFLIGRTLVTMVNNHRRIELTLFLGILAVMFFNPASVVTLLVFWWLIGSTFHEASRG